MENKKLQSLYIEVFINGWLYLSVKTLVFSLDTCSITCVYVLFYYFNHSHRSWFYSPFTVHQIYQNPTGTLHLWVKAGFNYLHTKFYQNSIYTCYAACI